MVLLHGVGGNHASWFPQIAALQAQFRLVTIDARGFGKSTDAEGAGRDKFVDDLDFVWKALGLKKAILLGQSMGGGTAVAFSCRFPERVKALVLADTLVGITLPPWLKSLMDPVIKETSTLSQVERVLGETTRKIRSERVTLYTQIAGFNSVGLKTLVGVQETHSIEELAATKLPVLFLLGSEDVLFPPEIARQVHNQIPNSMFVEIEKSGHSAHFETPELFNAHLIEMLKVAKVI